METTFDQAPRDMAQRISDAIDRLGLAVRSQQWRRGAAARLNPTQVQILSLIGAGGRAPIRLSALATALAVTPATASDSVAVLLRKGLVERRNDPDDRRALDLRLTSSGQALLDEWRRSGTAVAAAAAAMPPDTQADLLRLLITLIRSLQIAGAIPVARMCVGCAYFRPNVHADADTPHHCAFVDAPFGDRHLRIDCPEHEMALQDQADAAWLTFTGPSPGAVPA